MTHDDLQQLWLESTRQLEEGNPSLRFHLVEARERREDKVRSRLTRVKVVLWYETVLGAVAVLLAGSYLADHWAVLRLAVPALGLHLCTIALLATAIWQLVLLSGIDFSDPVVSLVRRLARLRAARSHSNRWLLFGSPLLWVLLVLVVPQALFGLDIYAITGPAWVLGNLAFGGVVLLFAAWLVRTNPKWSQRWQLLHRLGSDLTGRRLAEAEALLEEVSAFESGGLASGSDDSESVPDQDEKRR